jgi:hypothetical protein
LSTQNLISEGDRGLALIAAPEEILYESTLPGMAVVEVGLDWMRALRAGRDGDAATPSCGAKQGVLSEQWQRPELYDTFYPRPLRRAAE